jgi:hypothetical protein
MREYAVSIAIISRINPILFVLKKSESIEHMANIVVVCPEGKL